MGPDDGAAVLGHVDGEYVGFPVDGAAVDGDAVGEPLGAAVEGAADGDDVDGNAEGEYVGHVEGAGTGSTVGLARG